MNDPATSEPAADGTEPGDIAPVDVPAGVEVVTTRLRPTRSRGRKWPLFVALALLIAGLVVFLAAVVPIPWFARTPGSVIEVTDFVATDAETYPALGDLYFLTVSSQEVTALGYLEALLDDEIDLREREQVLPQGITPEERKRQGLSSQETSKQTAVFVALNQLGYEASFDGEGALVAAVVESSPADGVLEVDDVIIAVDGIEVRLAGDLVDALADYAPGDSAVLTIERLVGESATEVEVIEVPLVLGTNPEDSSRGFIGVALDTFKAVTVFPVDIEIDSQNIGGSSAGMMYTLGIMNLLTEEDLTRGHRIAGTGTIRPDGDVGPIGGVRQKVFAARRAGARYVIVPVENYEDALTAEGDGILIVPVETIEDALTFLDSLEPAGPDERIAG